MRQLIEFNFSTERNMAPDEQRRLVVNIVEVLNKVLNNVLEQVHAFDYDENLSQTQLDFVINVKVDVDEPIQDYDRKQLWYELKRLSLPIEEGSVILKFK